MKLTLLSEVSSRRRFLKQGIGLATAASTGDVRGLAKAGMGFDPFSGVSDDELMDTPEREWITKIPGARLLNILKNNPTNYAGKEIASKIIKAMGYGSDFRQSGQMATILAKKAEEAGIDVEESLMDWLQKNSDFEMPVPSSDHYEINFVGTVDQYVKQAREFGINLPLGKMRRMSHEFIKDYYGDYGDEGNTSDDKSGNIEKQEPKDINVPDDYRLASPMHQPYEQRLNRALMLSEAWGDKLDNGSIGAKARQIYIKLVEDGTIELNIDGIPYFTQEALDAVAEIAVDMFKNRPDYDPIKDNERFGRLNDIESYIKYGWCPKWKRLAKLCGRGHSHTPRTWGGFIQ